MNPATPRPGEPGPSEAALALHPRWFGHGLESFLCLAMKQLRFHRTLTPASADGRRDTPVGRGRACRNLALPMSYEVLVAVSRDSFPLRPGRAPRAAARLPARYPPASAGKLERVRRRDAGGQKEACHEAHHGARLPGPPRGRRSGPRRRLRIVHAVTRRIPLPLLHAGPARSRPPPAGSPCRRATSSAPSTTPGSRWSPATPGSPRASRTESPRSTGSWPPARPR